MSQYIAATPEVVDSTTPCAEFEVSYDGLRVHVGDATITLETASEDADDQAAMLDRAARVLDALAAGLPTARAELAENRAEIGEPCLECRGAGGQPVARRDVDWVDCPYCGGSGRLTRDAAA